MIFRALAALTLGACFFARVALGDGAQFEPLRLNGELVRWFPGDDGKIRLTYALADRDAITPEAVNCQRMRSPTTVASSAGISRDRLRAILQVGFKSWEQATNITFVEIADASRADIIIGEQSDPKGYAFTSVLPGPRTANGFREISKAAICLNPERPWKDGIGGDVAVYDLTYTFKHEIGHVIGLDHPSSRGQLMSFRYTEDLRDLTAGDVAGAAFVYGVKTAAPSDGATPAAVQVSSTRR